MDLDEMITELGQFGKYQYFIFVLLFFPVLMCGFSSMEYVFITMDVTHRCRVLECESVSGPVEFMPHWLPYAVPFTTGGNPEKCLRYRVLQNKSSDSSCSAEDFDTTLIDHCDTWVFEEKTRTIVQDFKLMCPEDDLKRTILGSVPIITGMVCAPILGILCDRVGRKTVLMFGCVFGPLLELYRSVITDYETFKFTQYLIGILSGTLYLPCYVTGMEILSPQKRLLGSVLINSFFCMGMVLLGLIMWCVQDWRLLLRLFYFPFLGLASYFWLMPESIRWLFVKRRYGETEDILCTIARTNRTMDKLPNVLQHLNEHAFNENVINTSSEEEKGSFKNAPLYRVLKSRVIILRVITLLICWNAAVIAYYGLSLNSISVGGNRYLNFILVSLVEVPAYFVTLWLPDLRMVGRRWSTVGSFFTIAVSCALFYFLVDNGESLIHDLLFLLSKFAATLVLTILYIYTSEVFPTELRSTLMSVCVVVGHLSTLIVPEIPLLKIDPMIIFGTTSIIGGLFALSCPETLNTKLPDTIKEAERLGKPL